MAKLAGGVFVRTERRPTEAPDASLRTFGFNLRRCHRQDTFLEGMGFNSIDNCLKA